MLTDDLVADAQSRLLSRIEHTAKEVGDRFPQAADPRTGRWDDKPRGAWTDGFWPALCWLAYQVTGEERFRDWGREAALRLRSREETETHDIGFLFFYGAVPGWRAIGDPRLRDLALRAADRLAGMAHPRAGVIAVGADAEVSSGIDDVTIDCMMNLQLLWWAASETGEPRYLDVAVSHAERTAAWHPRPDGSCFQSVHFDLTTGEAQTKHTHQGWSADGCWSRGLGWCCYGFLEAYHATGRADFLEVSRRAFEYHVRHAGSDAVPFNDYRDPRIPDAPRDTSAAAILASACLGLAAADPGRIADFRDAASRLLERLIRGHLTPLGPHDQRPAGMLLHGCYNERAGDAPDNELITGDYFLLEALVRWQQLERGGSTVASDELD
jgi:unsaturated chondroitin disaccharide hydrolase